jgi:hypothetical protein
MGDLVCYTHPARFDGCVSHPRPTEFCYGYLPLRRSVKLGSDRPIVLLRRKAVQACVRACGHRRRNKCFDDAVSTVSRVKTTPSPLLGSRGGKGITHQWVIGNHWCAVTLNMQLNLCVPSQLAAWVLLDYFMMLPPTICSRSGDLFARPTCPTLGRN